MSTTDMASNPSGWQGRHPVWTALSAVGRLLWFMLALHGLFNLFKPTPLRETIIPIVSGALVLSALMFALTKQRQRREMEIAKAWARAWASAGQGTRPAPETGQ